MPRDAISGDLHKPTIRPCIAYTLPFSNLWAGQFRGEIKNYNYDAYILTSDVFLVY